MLCAGCGKSDDVAGNNLCEFEGKLYQFGDIHPEDDCVSCQRHPGYVEFGGASWRWRNDCCVIDGKIFRQGEINPENACQFCNPVHGALFWGNPASWWSSFPTGTPCEGGKCDFNGNCRREGFCLIGGIEFADGEVNPSDSCMVCRYEANPNYWTNNCCTIFGDIFQDSTRHPNQDCWWCDAQSYPGNWTYVPKDYPCENGLCNGLGSCLP